MKPFVAMTGSRPSTVNFSVPDWTIHHSRVSPFMRRGVFLPGRHRDPLREQALVVDDGLGPILFAFVLREHVVQLRVRSCTPVQPPDVAFGDSTISGAS